VENIMAEIYTRGPVAAGVDATALESYTGGILTYVFFPFSPPCSELNGVFTHIFEHGLAEALY
jgi:hypothetical protein